MLARLRYVLKRLWAQPGFYVMKVLGRFNSIRRVVPVLCNRRLKRPLLNTNSMFGELGVEKVVQGLKRDGVFLGLRLPGSTVESILNFAATAPCFGNLKEDLGFSLERRKDAEASSGQKFVLGGYFNSASVCPAIGNLHQDPFLWAVAEGYLGTRPRYLGHYLWWSFSGERSHSEQNLYAQLYHFDLDDYASLKFFFYLTDVDDASGPHVVVRSSHRLKNFRHQIMYRRIRDGEVSHLYGEENILKIRGRAGEGFAEDSYCIHRATTPSGRDRLILQLQFSIFDYGFQTDERPAAILKMIPSAGGEAARVPSRGDANANPLK
jgi:hypothetical protein